MPSSVRSPCRSLSQKLHVRLLAHWWHQQPLTGIYHFILYGFQWLFKGGLFFRSTLYRFGFFKRATLPVPSIVIGNLGVGGSGKTPTSAFIYQLLKKQGYFPLILLRGYRGTQQKSHVVCPRDTAQAIGDEAKMLSIQLPLAPIVVGKNRLQAAQLGLRCFPQVNVILLDDGLQHWALKPHISLCLLDQRLLGNQALLPLGPLREPPQQLLQYDALLVHRPKSFLPPAASVHPHLFTLQYQLHLPKNCCHHISIDWSQLAKTPVYAIAAIANPQRFFEMLTQKGLEVIACPYPDHHIFSKKDFLFPKHYSVIMTEKDAVKCVEFCQKNWWYVPAEVQLDKEFSAFILEKLHAI